MSDRFLVWLGAGVVTAGVSMAMVGGAGLALADGGSTAGSDTGSSSESSNSTENKPDSDNDGSKPDEQKDEPPANEESAEPSDDDTDGATEIPATDQDATGEVPSEGTDKDEPSTQDTKKGSERDATEPPSHEIDKPASAAPKPEANKDAAEDAEDAVADNKEPEAPEQTEAAKTPAAETGPVDEAVAAAEANQTSVETALAFAAAEPAATPVRPTLINIVGTFFWGLFDLVSKMIEGPQAVPPGSTVTAGRSTLQIDCGDGYTADADWYFPTEGEPDKFIYFQHGFPGRAGGYNLTLAELAERNNAVVVAASITGNPFACDACNLTGDPMHAAVARLFEGDRAALIASAEAAGYEGTLPEQFVFVGHSHGGQLAAGAAGYFRDFAAADEKSNLVGAVLFDSSAAGGALARALDKLPADFPVLHISAAPAPLNGFGAADAVFEQKRPEQFNGIQLVGGTHSDGYRSSTAFGLAQFFVGLATGPSTPENVEAVQVLAQGWINDMYEGRVYEPATRTGIYGEPGETVVDIPTDAGLAHGYVLPAPTSQLTRLLSLVFGFFFELPTAFNLDVCAEEPSASAATATCGAATVSTA